MRRTPVPGGNQPPSTYTGLQPTQPPFLGGGGAASPTPAPFSTGIFAPSDPQTIGPIVGVRAKKHHRALRKWREREFTDERRFIAGDADNAQQLRQSLLTRMYLANHRSLKLNRKYATTICLPLETLHTRPPF